MKGSNPACEVKVKLVKEEGELQIMVTFINSVEEKKFSTSRRSKCSAKQGNPSLLSPLTRSSRKLHPLPKCVSIFSLSILFVWLVIFKHVIRLSNTSVNSLSM
ncbi:hypothetical protein GmHk_05G012615 [Glycine max]|nr:hypothetical protein GmHk_05G012615 [Glycine max]